MQSHPSVVAGAGKACEGKGSTDLGEGVPFQAAWLREGPYFLRKDNAFFGVFFAGMATYMPAFPSEPCSAFARTTVWKRKVR